MVTVVHSAVGEGWHIPRIWEPMWGFSQITEHVYSMYMSRNREERIQRGPSGPLSPLCDGFMPKLPLYHTPHTGVPRTVTVDHAGRIPSPRLPTTGHHDPGCSTHYSHPRATLPAPVVTPAPLSPCRPAPCLPCETPPTPRAQVPEHGLCRQGGGGTHGRDRI